MFNFFTFVAHREGLKIFAESHVYQDRAAPTSLNFLEKVTSKMTIAGPFRRGVPFRPSRPRAAVRVANNNIFTTQTDREHIRECRSNGEPRSAESRSGASVRTGTSRTSLRRVG